MWIEAGVTEEGMSKIGLSVIIWQDGASIDREATGGALGGADWSSVFDTLYLRPMSHPEELLSRRFTGNVQSGRSHLSH